MYLILFRILSRYHKKISVSRLTQTIFRKISSAVARGYAVGTGTTRPAKIYVSPRTLEKAETLRDAFPDIVIIAENEEIVQKSDVVFIGLLPNVASEVLKNLCFRDEQTVCPFSCSYCFSAYVILLIFSIVLS